VQLDPALDALNVIHGSPHIGPDMTSSSNSITERPRHPVSFDHEEPTAWAGKRTPMMKTKMKIDAWRNKGIAVALILCALNPAFVAAQDWPSRPVTMIVPLAPGSGIDVLGRILATRLSELLGQQVIVENVSGAGGMTGASRVARAPPDGYQFLLGGTGTHAQIQTLYKHPLYNAVTDFAPVALVAEQPIVLIARKETPADDLQQFIAYAKASQARMQYGSAGAGSAAHLACVLFNAAIGVNVTHVPYRGGGPAMQDLIAGRIDYQCPLIAIAIQQIESRNVKAIAILSRNRSPSLPNLASAHEQGLTDFDASNWSGFFLPRNTPTAIIQKLRDATIATINTQAVQARLKEIGVDLVAPERTSPAYLEKFVEREIEKWAAPIRASGVTGE
jgi:tripartite-type tricarboxylate transporter receptor subunit TctC